MNFGSAGGGMTDGTNVSMATVFNAPTAFGCEPTGRSCADVISYMNSASQAAGQRIAAAK